MDLKASALYKGKFPSVTKAFSDEAVDLIVTDPPYGVDFQQTTYNDNPDHVLGLVDSWFAEMRRLLKEDCFLFMFVSVKQIHKFIESGISAGLTFRNIVATRSYNNGTRRARNNFGFQFQPVLMFSKGSGRAFNDVDAIPTSEAWFKDKRNKDPKPFTYEYPNWLKTEWFFATAKRSSKNKHPNEKNVDLIEFLIKLTTNEEEVVLDPFMGSGTTIVAAVNTNRKFIGIEMDKGYFKVAHKRLAEAYETDT